MKDQEILMEVVNPHAAGIDVGSRSHWVAVGQNEQDVQEFGVFNVDLFQLADWLLAKKVKTVVIESIGTYWQNLYAVLISRGFHVILCNGKFTKNIKGKKTDSKDCQWIQKLHNLGLLSSSFLPDEKTEQLRTYCRHRTNLLRNAASTSQTGLLIIRAICEGETNPDKLSDLRHGNCRKGKEEITKALHSNGRKDYLFALQQELDTYDYLQNNIAECDKEIEQNLNAIIENDENKKQHHIDPKPYKRITKNTPKDIDLNLKSYQMFEGTDLLAIEGMSFNTVLTIMSELGIEGIKKFPTSKHFTSWLRVTPNNKISGGKVLSSRIPKGSNRTKIALRNAANAIGNLKESTPLRDFFQRINFRKGRVSAVSATARKLAVIIWNMVVKGTPYINPEGYLF